MTSPWLPILAALIAASSALAGVILTSYLARKDKRLELSWRASQESKDFLISRGEELYVQLDRMDRYVTDRCRLIQSLCGSTITFDEFRSARHAGSSDRQKFSISRIKVSIRAFFPSLAPSFEELAKNLDHLDKIDRALVEADRPDARLLLNANADAVRLQKLVSTKGEQLRQSLVRLLSTIFSTRGAFSEQEIR